MEKNYGFMGNFYHLIVKDLLLGLSTLEISKKFKKLWNDFLRESPHAGD